MKKFFISAVAVLAVLSLNAKVFTVGDIHQVNHGNGSIDKPVISADGSFVVAQGTSGLQKIDLTTGKVEQLVKGHDLYNITISADGKTVAYTRPSYGKDHLRYTALEAVNVDTKKSEVVVKASRNLASGTAVTNQGVKALNNGKIAKKTINKQAVAQEERPVIAINMGHLMVNGKAIDPQGKGSYLWPSLSPDGTKVVYWYVGKGCFVSNLDGSNVQPVGNLQAAVWAGNDALVGMQTKDNGEYVTEGRIVAHSLVNGENQVLTSDNMIAVYPSATASRIAFVDEAGSLYFMDINK
ncbi:MAG: PD40 domain-containing protein [Muribaculaceae bacterium]|nr:PD40 domain-containing protein [Muribaculaceae bacterium]